MSDRLGIQVAVDSSSFVVRRFSFWSVQGICIALLTYQSKRVLQGLSKRPSLHSLITLLKRCVSQMQLWLCMLSSGPMKAAHALDSTKNMTECSKGSQRLKKTRYFMKKFTNRAGGSFLFFQMEEMEKNGQTKIRLHKTHTGRAGLHFMIYFLHKIPFFRSKSDLIGPNWT